MKNWTNKPKTIAYELNQHQNELYPLMESKGQLPILHEKVLEILSGEALSKSSAAVEAKKIFQNIFESHNWSRYASTLVTYMTGIKC